MRLLLCAVTALALSACSSLPQPVAEPLRTETVRIDATGDLSLKAGGYVDVAGFAFDIWFDNDATDLSTPTLVTWGITFKNYCRDRDSWVPGQLGAVRHRRAGRAGLARLSRVRSCRPGSPSVLVQRQQ